jgi:hypothetical protein
MPPTQEIAKSFEIPFEPDPVESPTILHGHGRAVVLYTTRDEEHVRLTFENLDALRVCRGEYPPYSAAAAHRGSCYTIENSSWLVERHSYESKHYRGFYEFGNNVDDMLTDFDHFLFRFHDEFVESIAAGIWFEHSTSPFEQESPFTDHPLMDLTENTIVERFEMSGITCDVRSIQLPEAELVSRSKLCSQPLFHFGLTLDGGTSVSCRFDVRTRRGKTKTTRRNGLGKKEAVVDGLITLSQAKDLIRPYLNEVHERRRAMGKDN